MLLIKKISKKLSFIKLHLQRKNLNKKIKKNTKKKIFSHETYHFSVPKLKSTTKKKIKETLVNVSKKK